MSVATEEQEERTENTEEKPQRPVAGRWVAREDLLTGSIGSGVTTWQILEQVPDEHRVTGDINVYASESPYSFHLDGQEHFVLPLRGRYLEEHTDDAPLDARAIARYVEEAGYADAHTYARDLLRRLDGFLKGSDDLGDLFGFANRRKAITDKVRSHAEAHGVRLQSVAAARLCADGFNWEQAWALGKTILDLAGQKVTSHRRRTRLLGQHQGVFGERDLNRHASKGEFRKLLDEVLPLPEPTIPDDVKAMSQEELARTLVFERQRNEETIDALHAQADDHDLCPTFDRIMVECGWPPRPEKVSMIVRFKVREKFDSEWIRRNMGRAYEMQAEGDVFIVRHQDSRFTKRMEVAPPDGTPAQDCLTEDDIQQAAEGIGVDLSMVDLVETTVHR